MPKISLADQVDSLKEKISGMFSRAKKPVADKTSTISGGDDKQTLVKRVVPLVLVAALLGAGYTYQSEIMSLAFPTNPNGQPAPLPVAQMTTSDSAEMTAENINEPAIDADSFAIIEPLETTEITNEAPLTLVSLDMESEALTSAKLDAIDRKLLALQALEMMKNSVAEETPAEFTAAATEEQAAPQTIPAHEEMVAMSSDDKTTAAPMSMEEDKAHPEVAQTSIANETTAQSMRANEWTLWQPSNQWAVQLMAVQTEEYLHDFISSNGLENGATYFEFYRDGHHYYALVMGVYNTRIEANKAAQTLAATFNLQPWVRSIQSIQNAINYDFEVAEGVTLSQR